MPAEDMAIQVAIFGGVGFVGYKFWKDGKFNGILDDLGLGDLKPGGNAPRIDPNDPGNDDPQGSGPAELVPFTDPQILPQVLSRILLVEWDIYNTGAESANAQIRMQLLGGPFDEVDSSPKTADAHFARTDLSLRYDYNHLPDGEYPGRVMLLQDGQVSALGGSHDFLLVVGEGFIEPENIQPIGSPSAAFEDEDTDVLTVRWQVGNQGETDGQARMDLLVNIDNPPVERQGFNVTVPAGGNRTLVGTVNLTGYPIGTYNAVATLIVDGHLTRDIQVFQVHL